MRKICKVEGCNEYCVGKGYCGVHYSRFKRTGNTEIIKIESLKNEIWEDIKEYEGIYQVSSLGRIKSLDRVDSKGLNRYGKLMSQATEKCGYKVIQLTQNGKGKGFKVHRLVAQTFISNLDNKPQVNHIDGNKQNNNVNNLEWCTGSENMIHAYETGLEVAVRGEKHYMHNRTGSKNQNYGVRGAKNVSSVKVKCITTGEYFDCIREAGEFYKIDNSGISACCRGKQKSTGKHPTTGEKLVWRYAENS